MRYIKQLSDKFVRWVWVCRSCGYVQNPEEGGKCLKCDSFDMKATG